jgi:hypothetical protein
VIRSVATLVWLGGKHKTHKLVDAQLMQHNDDNQHTKISKKIGPELGYICGYSRLFVTPFIFLFK